MKVTKKYDQHRRDCTIDMECESCKNTATYKNAYDDRNFWDNVVPGFKCENCGKSSKELGIEVDFITTRYSEHEVV